MALSVHEILGLFCIRGAAACGGEAVSPLDHALQCAQFAEEAGAPPELVTASLLHDVGHLLVNAPRDDAFGEADNLHQYHPVLFLRGVFPEAVLEPIRLHVEAKRYLCHVDPGYRHALTPGSRHSLVVQGGPHNALEARMFLARPYADCAIRLRRWDDLAKTPGEPTPALDHYVHFLRACASPAHAPEARWI